MRGHTVDSTQLLYKVFDPVNGYAETMKDLGPNDPEATVIAIAGPANMPSPEVDSAGTVVLDFCAAVRGVLNDDQGGPLHPPSLRMAEALHDEKTDDPIRHQMATVMLSFVAGLFVGDGVYEVIKDNLDLERWFRLPKSHERRIHGHRHAGIRIVLEGPTLVHALDAHAGHPEPFTVDELLQYRTAREPPSQTQALHRRKIMRKARSEKTRSTLLADLERRYRESPNS